MCGKYVIVSSVIFRAVADNLDVALDWQFEFMGEWFECHFDVTDVDDAP